MVARLVRDEGAPMTSRRRADPVVRARRDLAMDRPVLRQPSSQREFPAGPTSAPIKTTDPATRRLVDEAVRTFDRSKEGRSAR